MRPSSIIEPARGQLGLHGRVRTTTRDSGLVVAEQVHDNVETTYALNSIATWLVGGSVVVAPAPPQYIALGTGVPNLLSAAQADIETTPTGWQALTNCAVAASTAQSWSGLASLAMTASSAANMAATTTPGTGAVPVAAGTAYAASLHFRAATAARAVGANIGWYDSGGTLLSTTVGATTNDITTGWTRVYVTGAAPAGAAFAAVQAAVTAPANGEVHYVDGGQLEVNWDGPSAWAAPSSPTPASSDTVLSAERYATRAQVDTGYTQTALAVLLHTYQQADPSGAFLEAGLFDAAAPTATLGGTAAVGATALTLAANAPAVKAGTRIYFPAAGEYATVAVDAAAGATSWTLTDQLLIQHLSGATVVVFNGNLWAHVSLTNVAKAGTELLTVQWEISLTAS